MAPSPKQKRKVKRVMHEFKEGELKAGRGKRGAVKSRRQAVAIAMSESGQARKRGKRMAAKTTAKRAAAGRTKRATRSKRRGA